MILEKFSLQINFIMSVSQDLKILLLKEKATITELAKLATEKSGKNYTVFGISQKLARNSMKYDESINLIGTHIDISKDPISALVLTNKIINYGFFNKVYT